MGSGGHQGRERFPRPVPGCRGWSSDSGIAWFGQLRRGTPLASGNLGAGGTTALLGRSALEVTEGDLIHFGVDPRGSFTTDATGVLARVSYGHSAAPEQLTRTLDAPLTAPTGGGTAALRLLPGGDQTLRYGGGANNRGAPRAFGKGPAARLQYKTATVRPG